MTNSSSNTPETGSEKVEKSKKKSGNIENLLQEAIFREFGKPAHPEKVDSYKSKKDAINEMIRFHMYDLQRENMEDWGDITEGMIHAVQDSEINERILRMSRDLILMRKRAFNRALELFPAIKNQGSSWSDILQNAIAGYNENELKNYATRTALMRKFVYATFPDIKGQTMQEFRDFNKIFHDKEQYLHDEKDRKRFARIYHDFSAFHQVPERDDIIFILSAYASASDKRKQEILTELEVSISLEQAHDWGVIDDAFLYDFAKKEFGEMFESLGKKQQDSFIRGLLATETARILVEDLPLKNMGDFFGNEKKRKNIANTIYDSLLIDAPESLKEETVTEQIRKQKQKEALEKGIDEEDYDLYEEFVNRIVQKFSGKATGLKLLGASGCVVRFHDAQTGEQYIRVKRVRDENNNPLEINNGSELGIELEPLPVSNGRIQGGTPFTLSYDEFEKFFETQKDIAVLKNTDFDNLLVLNPEEAGKDGKIYDARPVDADPANATNIVTKLDLIDSVGRGFGFEPGTCFIAPSTDEKGTTDEADIWMVKRISGDTVDLIDSLGKEMVKGYPLSEFFNFVASTPSFARIAKISTDVDMVKELGEYGLDSQAKLKDGQLIVTEKDSHGHEVEKTLSCFADDDGGHIRVESLGDGRVRFGEFDDSGEGIQKAKEYAKQHGIEKTMEGYYTWRTMSYPAFIRYLKKNKLKASKDFLFPDAGNAGHDLHGDHHHEHAHMEGSFLKRIMKWQNPASIWKGFEMLYHGIEHTLEKGAKLDAARFAMGTASFFNLPDSVAAQVYSDITTASKEIIEKYEQKIFGLPGPRGREKCIHIAHNKDSRPEEVMSAINYMLKSYGHLYGEDIKHFQPTVNKHNIATADPGYFAFFDAFVLTSKLPGELNEWRSKAYKKAITEMGSEGDYENEPTEEQLIHALFKSIDGNWGDFPYAASVVKASGGPSGLEKVWKFEGFENAFKKGKEQTQMVNAQGRLNKAVGYFNTHEIYKAVGAMEAVAAKVKAPKYQAIPFIWAVGGYSRFASHTALQKLKAYAENGMSFHAFGFLRNEQSNNLYRDTVRLALNELIKQGKIPAGALDDFNTTCKRMETVEDKKVTEGKYNGIPPAMAMMNFWQKYQGRGLHDMLQGNNGWMTKKSRDGDETVKAYQNRLVGEGGAHGMQLKKNAIPGVDYGTDWYDEHGYESIILAKGENGLNSLDSMLNKVKFTGTVSGARPMDQDTKEKVWDYVRKYMNSKLKDTDYFGGDLELQKEQYLAHRKEIIHYFAEQLTARSITGREENAAQLIEAHIATYPYYRELQEMGIDPHAIFDETIEKQNAEADYKRWRYGTGSVSSPQGAIPNIEDMVRGKSNTVIAQKPTPQPKAGPRMKHDDWRPGKSTEAEWKDDDAVTGGGASNIFDFGDN